MDVEIFVHGVSNGNSFWGKEEDRKYFDKFYNQNSSDAVKYLIQTRSSNDRIYCYYNYLVYKNVIGNDGREGSFFGLSIRFDEYCKDFMGIYKILDNIFTFHVLNKILKFQNGKYKYTISGFDSSSKMMNDIETATTQLLTSRLTDESFCALKGFAIGGGNTPTGNLLETTDNAVETNIRKYGNLALSPYYPTVREQNLTKQYKEDLQRAKQQYEEMNKAEISSKEQEIRSLNKTLVSEREKISNLQKEINKKNNIINEKDSTINELKNKIRQEEQNKKATKITDSIKNQIIELANILGAQRVNEEENPFSVKRLIPYINLAMLTLIVILIFFKVSPKESIPNNSFEDLQNTIQQLKTENERLRLKLSSHASKNETSFDMTETSSGSQKTTKQAYIDVSNYNESKKVYLKKGYKYTASIKGHNTEGKWEIKGGAFNSDRIGKSVEFTPSSDSVTLIYNNGELSIERQLKVESN